MGDTSEYQRLPSDEEEGEGESRQLPLFTPRAALQRGDPEEKERSARAPPSGTGVCHEALPREHGLERRNPQRARTDRSGCGVSELACFFSGGCPVMERAPPITGAGEPCLFPLMEDSGPAPRPL
ncbi:hypothetical protein AAFF_G00206770 [Aldrovandia affinis]|uniref:Uncharacterized protein n=1 Tax=Aldrovandia affinis TaxID=143900 RepID=A0AAD7RHT0_9TELE|nr:hypothetical protein AAFF_G00206770 [Aldrovandia affinis]